MYNFAQGYSAQAGGTGEFILSTLIRCQAATLIKCDLSQSHKNSHLNHELPSWQSYLAKITQPFLKRVFEWHQSL